MSVAPAQASANATQEGQEAHGGQDQDAFDGRIYGEHDGQKVMGMRFQRERM